MLKFSVLIAHYNNSNFFEDCYRSLLNQTFTNWEAIIVDDGSHPEEILRVRKIVAEDPRFLLIENGLNKGVGFTKSRCIKYAKGEICGFLDPDDALSPTALELCIKPYENENIVATHSKMWNCDSALKPKHACLRSRRIRNGRKLFFNVRFPVTHFFTFRKEIFDATEGLDESLTSAVDQDLYLKLYERGDFKFIPEPLYLYRIHDKGVSQQLSKKKELYRNWDSVLRETLKRRKISRLYGREISEISSLPHYIFRKSNTLFHKIARKIS